MISDKLYYLLQVSYTNLKDIILHEFYKHWKDFLKKEA